MLTENLTELCLLLQCLLFANVLLDYYSHRNVGWNVHFKKDNRGHSQTVSFEFINITAIPEDWFTYELCLSS